MGLKEYHRKRDFGKTAEPKGKEAPSQSGMYVMQRHAASRLHYDLRLELNGVLKSWAVPKGPSLDPSEKRLAIHVEDHPVEYGSFEGIIPEDEYGGGTVMLWDKGTWEPVGDPEKEYQKGRLKFDIHGEKLRGTWTLAQMKKSENGKNWLLIKHKDGEAISEKKYNILQDKNKSVETKRSMDEITQARNKNEWQSNRPSKKITKNKSKQKVRMGSGPIKIPHPSNLKNSVKAKQPDKIKPQRATLVKDPPGGDDWLHEIKYDGYRILSVLRDHKVRLISRNSKDWTDRFPSVAESLQSFPVKECILDGEVVIVRKDGTTDFQALQNALKGGKIGRLVYYLFDIPFCDGYSLMKTPLLDRKSFLKLLIQRIKTKDRNIHFSDHILSSGDKVFQKACLLALEGIISKNANSPYEQKRTRNWLKVKCVKRQEFVIGGFSVPSGSRKYFGALLMGYYRDKNLIYAGRVGTGYTDQTLHELSQKLGKIEQKKPPFSNPPAGADARRVHWVTPELVAEVEFTEWTQEGILRHPSFKGLREDKPPKEVTQEQPGKIDPGKKTRDEKKQPAPFGLGESTDIVVAGIRISNPDKVLYPDMDITKRKLAEFYHSIADFILPHVIHRPLTLVRCPEGRQKKCFYQKHVKDSTPDEIRGIPIREKSGTQEYLLIDDLQGLISLVQMGVLEIHPWGSREKNIEKPDILTFDLDPDPAVGWSEVINGAKLLHDRLQQLGLESFVKTSGGKGLHIVIPMEARSEWEEAKAFAKAFAQDFVRKRPDRFVATMSKAKRKGKIFIDYVRNNRGATSVAAYSTRAKKGAPVSTPVRWNEVTEQLKPDSYTVENLLQRLSAQKEDPWEGFFDIRQSITKKMKEELIK